MWPLNFRPIAETNEEIENLGTRRYLGRACETVLRAGALLYCTLGWSFESGPAVGEAQREAAGGKK